MGVVGSSIHLNGGDGNVSISTTQERPYMVQSLDFGSSDNGMTTYWSLVRV
jgi:hypothetical protein